MSASAQDRAAVHRALAEVTDPEVDPDRRAWHLAQATPGLNEEVAAELERCAGRAQARGGLAASAAFLERAVTLTADPARRGQRALAAAQAKHQAGIPQAALRLVALAEAAPLGELDSARVDLLRGQIAYASGSGADSPALLLKAAKRLEPLDSVLARETYRDAFYAAVTAGRLATGGDVQEIAEAVRAFLPPPPLDATSMLLYGRALLVTEGYAAGAPVMREALSRFRTERLAPDEELRWLPFACRACFDVWDDDGWWALSVRFSDLARGAGALSALRDALSSKLVLEVLCGELRSAASVGEEADAVSRAIGVPSRYPALILAAWQGQEAGRLQAVKEATEQVREKGEGLWLTVTAWATAVLYNGLGRYDEALLVAEAASAPHGEQLEVSLWAFSELVEAAARGGQPERAADAMARLEETTSASGTDWGLGTRARSRALLSDDDSAESFYREAVDRLGRTRLRAELARAHLVYGEWLRRQNRRVDARDQLRLAYEMLGSIGMEAFAERARRELLATGETVHKRSVDSLTDLTPQEAQIARLARDGLSNPEISTQLFLSPRTVEWHLRKVFTKLGISSRRQLRGALPEPDRRVLTA